MKKISLLCMTFLASLSLAACGKSHSYNLNKLRAEHARLLKQNNNKKHKHAKKHSPRSKKATQQSAVNKKASSNEDSQSKASDSSQNESSGNNKHSINEQTKHDGDKGEHLSPAEQANVNKGLYPNGTRRPETFANMDDYKRYNAWYQGYNYDPTTNTLTPMNDQQLNDMRQQMNADGGQNFK